MAAKPVYSASSAGKYPITYGREVYPAAELRFPVGREPGQARCFRELSGEGLFVNTLVSGGKGRGKTAGLVKRFLAHICGHPQRPGALVYDVKGDLAPYIIQWARAVGREDDVRVIDPDGLFKLRLFPAGMPAETIANIFVTAISTIAGGTDPREAFWVQSAEELIKFYIQLLRAAAVDMARPVSPLEILNLLGQDDDVQQVVNRILIKSECGEYTTAKQKHIVRYLDKFHHRHSQLDHRVRTSIEAEINRFMHDFSGYEMSRVFSPGLDDKCVSVDEIINDGALVVLRMPQCRYGEVSRFIGMLIKSQFYNAVMRRLTDATLNQQRPVFFVADEFQNFATIGGKVGADDQFAALSRQARAGMFCAIQELGSLYSVGGQNATEAVSNLIQNFQNHIMLRQDLTPRLRELLSGKGLTEISCLPKLKPFEALFFRDAENDARLIELGPYFGDWDYCRHENERQGRELAARRDDALKGLSGRGAGGGL